MREPRARRSEHSTEQGIECGAVFIFSTEVPMANRLDAYRKKRNFDVTSEPAPVKPRKAKTRKQAVPSFMIHKHDATRLHYDLRLEMDGVLASWAVPKGPSLDPTVRRLAVPTEDHPLAYGKFEGRIPDGEYGAGDSIIWDRGTYQTEPPGQASAMRKKGHIAFVLKGEKLHGRFHLVKTRSFGDKAQWLLFKGKDDFAQAGVELTTERPESVKTGVRETHGPGWKLAKDDAPISLLLKVWPPMLATLGAAPEVSLSSHVLEMKYDGFRAISGIVQGHVALQSRNGLDLSARFPQIAAALKTIHAREVVLDGEVIAVGEGGQSRFQELQSAGAEHRYAIFDLLWLDGEDLRSRPLEERRELLESVLAKAELPLQIAERVSGKIDAALARAERQGTEGLIAKRKGSTYVGARTRDWIKLKVSRAQELVVLGFTPMKNGRSEIGALLVGVREGARYRYAGKVGTGFSSALRAQLLRELSQEVVGASEIIDAPRIRVARWVKPRLVAQVAFTEWTTDGKLRHPRFQGLRDDKSPAEVIRQPAPSARIRKSTR
jgi:bifunctional non-homologous end joining protein LigD